MNVEENATLTRLIEQQGMQSIKRGWLRSQLKKAKRMIDESLVYCIGEGCTRQVALAGRACTRCHVTISAEHYMMPTDDPRHAVTEHRLDRSEELREKSASQRRARRAEQVKASAREDGLEEEGEEGVAR